MIDAHTAVCATDIMTRTVTKVQYRVDPYSRSPLHSCHDTTMSEYNTYRLVLL